MRRGGGLRELERLMAEALVFDACNPWLRFPPAACWLFGAHLFISLTRESGHVAVTLLALLAAAAEPSSPAPPAARLNATRSGNINSATNKKNKCH